MTISERLFFIMQENGVSIPELSRRTGIARRTIYYWQKKKTNPGADKIMIICEALQISPEELLMGEVNNDTPKHDFITSINDMETIISDTYNELSDANKRRLLAYVTMLKNNKQ